MMLLTLTDRELLLSLLDSVEQLALENIKLRIILESLPVAEQPGFSLDELLRETQLAGDSEAFCHAVYDGVRTAIRKQSDPELALRKLLEQFPKHGDSH